MPAFLESQPGWLFREGLNSFYFIQSITVDLICKENNFTPDFIKVDVEGAESFVLNGSKETARNHKPVYLVEIPGPEEMPMLKNVELDLTGCKEVNYTAYYMTNHSVLTDSKEIAYRGKCHLFLTHQDSEYPSYLKTIEQNKKLG